MAIQRAPKELTLGEAIEEGWRLASAGLDVAAAAREVVARGIDRDAAISTSEKGLAALIHNYRVVDYARLVAATADEIDASAGHQPALPANHGRNFAAELWKRRLQANYETADGTRKVLLGFNLADSTNLLGLARSRAAGLNRLAGAMEVAIAALGKHSAETIGVLPEKVQKQIAGMLA